MLFPLPFPPTKTSPGPTNRRHRASPSLVPISVLFLPLRLLLPTDAILRLHPVSPSNLYQIRRRLSARLRALLPDVRRDLESGAGLPPPPP